MGADIHMFLEYSDFTGSNGEPHWSCMGGRYNPGRDYKMFGLLAGVRGGDALFDTRGLPEGEHSYHVDGYMWKLINDEYAAKEYENYVSLADARRWGEPIINDAQGKPYKVRDPDLHSHSWLTLDEYKYVLAYYTLGDRAEHMDVDPADRLSVFQAVAALQGRGDRYDVGYDGIVGAMEAYEERGCKVRLIFCFDN